MILKWYRLRKLRKLLANRTRHHDSPWASFAFNNLNEAEQMQWMSDWYTRFYALRDLLDLDYATVMAEMDRMRNIPHEENASQEDCR